jgi:integrase
MTFATAARALARLRDASSELAERMGHKHASMSLDVYTHVMPPDEADVAALRPLLAKV